MTSHHMDSDPSGLSALKHLFTTAFVFDPADTKIYKLWLTVKPKDEAQHEQWFHDFGQFMQKFSGTLDLAFDPARLGQERNVRNGTIIYEYAFRRKDIERPATVERLEHFNIGYHVGGGVGTRFLQLGKEMREEGERLTQQYFELKVLDELHLVTGVEWTIRETRGARCYEPLLPVPNAYGALATLCSRNHLNLPDCVPDSYQSGAGMIRIPVEAVKYESYSGLKGKDIHTVFAPPPRGRGPAS